MLFACGNKLIKIENIEKKSLKKWTENLIYEYGSLNRITEMLVYKIPRKRSRPLCSTENKQNH